MKYIYQHLGLGDHIICNGLLRKLISDDDQYILFVKEHNIDTVSFMYRDIINMKFYSVKDDNEVHFYLLSNQIPIQNIILIGFNFIQNVKYFDESFYLQHNINFNERWNSFKLERDLISEKSIFDSYGVEEDNYIFIHDDESRNYQIDEFKIINKHLKIVRPKIGLTTNSFDYCTLMEKSKESHFIDSSFKLIFDCLKLRNTDIYFHLKLKNGTYRNGRKYDFADAINSYLDFKIYD